MEWVGFIGPEVAVLVLALFVLLVDLFLPRREETLAWLSVAFLTMILMATPSITQYGSLFSTPLFISDQLSLLFKQLFLGGTILVILLSIKYMRQFKWRAEYLSILLFVCLGMMLLASANEFVTIYVALEVVTISFFVLTAFKKQDRLSTEAGLKLYVQGFASSGILLYGLSLLYGFTGTTYLDGLVRIVGGMQTIQPVLLLAAALVIAGLAFKLSFAPFHMWVPDVYQGSPTPVTAFLSVGSKAAGFIVVIRLLVGALGALHQYLVPVLGALAIVTMFVGNLIALRQNNVKRLLGYSTIAHVGYMIVGIVMGSHLGLSSLLFYLVVYTFANLLAFTVVIALSDATGREDVKGFAALFSRSPMLAISMMIAVLSLGGIPPVAGFVGKFYLFLNAADAGFLVLAAAGVFNTLISMYYYLRIVREMFWGESTESSPIDLTLAIRVALAIGVVLTVLWGVYPAGLLETVERIASAFLYG